MPERSIAFSRVAVGRQAIAKPTARWQIPETRTGPSDYRLVAGRRCEPSGCKLLSLDGKYHFDAQGVRSAGGGFVSGRILPPLVSDGPLRQCSDGAQFRDC